MDEGNIIWGNKFELDKDDIFDVQDEIVRKTIISLLGNRASWRGPTEYPPIA